MTGKFEMISDSDGRRYPWYGAKHEVDTIRGPTKLPTPVSVTMNDNFFPQVTWHIPLKSYPREPKLTRIYRRQSFVTCLATRDPDSEASSVNILKAVKWSMEVEIAVNPTSPLGSRARLLKPREVLKPALIEDTCGLGDLIESYALKPPNANGSQTLIWRPFPSTDQSPSVIVLPGFTTVDMNSYIDDTEHLSDSLHDVITWSCHDVMQVKPRDLVMTSCKCGHSLSVCFEHPANYHAQLMQSRDLLYLRITSSNHVYHVTYCSSPHSINIPPRDQYLGHILITLAFQLKSYITWKQLRLPDNVRTY